MLLGSVLFLAVAAAAAAAGGAVLLLLLLVVVVVVVVETPSLPTKMYNVLEHPTHGSAYES